jgi:ribosomal protein S18 acetylase RimI-like enzyme
MLQLRRPTPSDYEYVKHVHHTAYKGMVIKQFGAWEEAVQDRFFEKTWSHPKFTIILFENEPCGFCHIDEHEDCLQLVHFAIDVAKQGRGIGSAFLSMFREMAETKGKRAQMNVMKTNTQARVLYERLGFRVCGENANQFLMRHDGNA